MKKIYITLLFLILFICCKTDKPKNTILKKVGSITKFSLNDNSSNGQFNVQVKKVDNYTITIKKGKPVTKLPNGFKHYYGFVGDPEKEKKCNFIIPTTLTNNSKYTLHYYSMSCSSQENYLTDNNNLEIAVSMCDKNVLHTLTLPPGQSRETKLLTILTIKSKMKFKIGFNLGIANKKEENNEHKEYRKNKNIIWSNTISM